MFVGIHTIVVYIGIHKIFVMFHFFSRFENNLEKRLLYTNTNKQTEFLNANNFRFHTEATAITTLQQAPRKRVKSKKHKHLRHL